MTQQRKFEHKETGIKAILEPEVAPFYCLVNETPEGFSELLDEEINLKLVENSNDWQEIIPELVKDRWYKKQNIVGRFREKKGDQYFFDNCVDIVDGHVFDKMVGEDVSSLAEATPDEIHKALDAIRIEKGLVEGIKVKDVNGAIIELERDGTCYLKAYDALMGNHTAGKGVCIYSGTLYKQGDWATKVSEPILVTEDGYEVYDVHDDFKILYFVNEQSDINELCAGDIRVAGYKHAFLYKENADQYAQDIIPRFSRADLEFLENEVDNAYKDVWENQDVVELCRQIRGHIENLKRSK